MAFTIDAERPGIYASAQADSCFLIPDS